MYFLWFLPAILLAVPLFVVWRMRRSQERALLNRIQSIIQPSVPDEVVPESAGELAREMKWISVNEFMTILSERSDLIVVDLRADAPSVPFPVPTASRAPRLAKRTGYGIGDASHRSEVSLFYGASNLNIFMIITSPCMKGSAPLYVLEDEFRLAEVA